MTKDQIDELMRENGIVVVGEAVYALCNLVEAKSAAAEREKVARWQIGSGYATGHGETIEDLLVELEWQVRESEREACAKACEEYAHKYAKDDDDSKAQAWMMLQCAAAIRARGQHD